MELGLSLGDASRPFGFTETPREASSQLGLGFKTILSTGPVISTNQNDQHQQKQEEERAQQKHKDNSHSTTELEDREATNEYHIISPSFKANNNTLLQLDLLPRTPAIVPTNLSFPWHPLLEENAGGSCSRGLDVNMLPAAVAAVEVEEDMAAMSSSSPNSAASSLFQLDLFIYSTRGGGVNGEGHDQRGCSSRPSDKDENYRGIARKKLRISKEQSSFLEESFEEHNTLNPKQKLALAKQLHLRPRQVEVWFQNRRARTKLKQTEVDYEYLKRCCETLTEENRRLQKELQELRALKTPNPFYMQLPATTLTMCPSCERVAPIPHPLPKALMNQPPKTLDLANPGFIHLVTPTSPQHLEF